MKRLLKNLGVVFPIFMLFVLLYTVPVAAQARPEAETRITDTFDPAPLLDSIPYSTCQYGGRFELPQSTFNGLTYVGAYDLWRDCEAVEESYVVVVAAPINSADLAILFKTPVATDGTIKLLGQTIEGFATSPLEDIQTEEPSTDDERAVVENRPDGEEEQTALQPATTIVSATVVPTTVVPSSVVPTTVVPTPAVEIPVAVVQVARLNVRTGPGINFARIDAVAQGEQLVVIGESDNCAWLNVETATNVVGWVSGAAQFVSLTGDCADISHEPTSPENPVTREAEEASQSEAVAEPEQPAEAAQPTESTAATESNESSEPTESSVEDVTAALGCYLFQNFVGPELIVTITSRDRDWNTTFPVTSQAEHLECFAPGRYTYTLDAPPPWDSTNGELDVNAGDSYYFPIQGRE